MLQHTSTMEQYLQAFSHFAQDYWVALPPLAEYAYNKSVYHTTQLMSFWVNNHFHPPMHFNTLNVTTNSKPDILPDVTLSDMHKTHWPLPENFLEAQIEQSKYTSSNDVTFKIGNNKVLGT
jgi:hypothetical protein